MKFRHSLVFVGALLTLASCTSDPKNPAAVATDPTAETTAELVVESTGPAVVAPEVGDASKKVAAVLSTLDARPEAKDLGARTGTGPCPLFDVPGATKENQAGTWIAEVKPAIVACQLADGIVGIGSGDIFAASVAKVKANQTEVLREFPPVDFAGGSINSICIKSECSAVWTDGAVTAYRSAADRESALTWLQTNLGAVLDRGAAFDATAAEFVAVPAPPVLGEASQQMVEAFRAQLSGDYDTYWEGLYPEQKSKIDKAVFVKCVTAPVPSDVPEVVATAEFDQAANLGVTDTKAKVVNLEFRSAAGTTARSAYTLFADGRWRWLLGQPELAAYASGKCK
jgi:hypothetical protein